MEAATELYAERGLKVGFDEIARQAGVGVGTVYRRFPNRQSLVAALCDAKGERLLDMVSTAAQIPDPWDGLVFLCERSIVEQQRDRAFIQVLVSGELAEDHLNESLAGVVGAIGELLRRAKGAGVVRADLEPVDLLVSLHLLGRLAVADGTEVWRRYLSLFLDSIRVQPGQQDLPGPVPTLHMFEELALCL